MKKILLGASGGIAAYKIPELARLFVKEGCAVKTILTPSAARFCTKDAIAALTGDSVYSGIFEPVFLEEGHTELAKWPDVFVVAPATANTTAKLTLGVADNLLTTTFLASPARKLVVPSMNTEMYDAEALQKNLQSLAARGASVLPPDTGDLACKTYGVGRMPDPWVIVEAAWRAAGPGTLNGKRVVVSAGGTVEPIDDVRLLTNRSSGKMGAALARAAYRLGADVTLILGRSEVCPAPPVRIVRADSIDAFRSAYRNLAATADFFVAAAAVGDFVPAGPEKGKIPRGGGISLRLKPSADLLAEIAADKVPGRIVVGFALEDSLDERKAKSKMAGKKLDAVFLNTTAALAADASSGVLLCSSGRKKTFKRMPKGDLAESFWEFLASLYL